MKKTLKILLGILAFILFTVLLVLAVVFVNPTILLNERTVRWALEKSKVLETWSWKKFELGHEWNKWNDRRLSADIQDFCFKLNRGTKIEACFSEISWDFDLRYVFGEGVGTTTHSPIRVRSPKIAVTPGKTEEPQEKSPPPDIYRYWTLVWLPVIPDIDVELQKITIAGEEKPTELDLKLKQTGDEMTAEALGFTLDATPKGFVVKAPKKYEIPEKSELIGPLYLRDLKLTGDVTPKGIPLHLSGSVEEAGFDVRANLKLPLREDFSSLVFRREFLSTVSGEVVIPEFKSSYARHAPKAYRKLPAPLNVMDGKIRSEFKLAKGDPESVVVDSSTRLDLSSAKEALDLSVKVATELPVKTFKPREIVVGVNFHEVKLELPRLSKKSPPPQFYPDKRFQKKAWSPPEKKTGPATEIDLRLEALDQESLHIATNLLDEPIRMNFDLAIGGGAVQEGFVSLLPLKTELFKRPIHVKSLVVGFNAPEPPVIKAEILFPLPEYKITMELEGPVNDPIYAFRSEPPLPQNDIYAVLLFGRPMADLSPDDSASAQRTNQILAQGILSLSVLYFLAGSPVEYVGYDPESGNATAQFGVTDKTSLRVGGGQEGMNSTGLRYSLGKGWYIDTSVQDTKQNEAARRASNYGVLLERVIAY